MPPEVSLPMPMQAKAESVKVQLEIRTSSVGRSMAYASAPLFSKSSCGQRMDSSWIALSVHERFSWMIILPVKFRVAPS